MDSEDLASLLGEAAKSAFGLIETQSAAAPCVCPKTMGQICAEELLRVTTAVANAEAGK